MSRNSWRVEHVVRVLMFLDDTAAKGATVLTISPSQSDSEPIGWGKARLTATENCRWIWRSLGQTTEIQLFMNRAVLNVLQYRCGYY